MIDSSKTPNEPIVLATAGLKETDAAVRAARDLASADKRSVTVVTVLEPPPLVAGEYGFVVPVEMVWDDRRDALRDRVRKQLFDVLGRDPDWPIEIRVGDPATAVAEAADQLGAALIVMGIGQHHLLDRALGSETALQTLRVSRIPIFAVPQSYSALPTRAVIGVDFGDAGVGAARTALALLPSLTHIALVHVAPRWDLQPTAYAEWRAEYERGVAPALDRVTREVAAPARVKVSTDIREGKPTKELLKAAEEFDADVIVVGSRGLGLLDRMLVGSTASGIIRGAQNAVFALPMAAIASSAEEGAEAQPSTVGA
jgi:nucleotide-binding universal stress UspA family protein